MLSQSELETIKVQSGPPDDALAQLEVERNRSQDNWFDFWEVKILEVRLEE